MLTQLPGFQDPVHDAQQTFQSLMKALARPGLSQSILPVTAPEGLVAGCAAAALTLFDLEIAVWLQPGFSEAVRGWLLFHTGCQFTDHPHVADFALIWDIAALPNLDVFNWGQPEYPEASTALLLQLPNLSDGDLLTLRGPGILSEIQISLPISAEFWQQWQAMTLYYPEGSTAGALVAIKSWGYLAPPVLISQQIDSGVNTVQVLNIPLQIRCADRADLPEVLKLYQQPDLDDGQALSLEAATQLWEKIQQYPNYRLFVAEQENRVVGTFMLLVMDNLLHLGTPSAIVEAVAVDPACHSQGVGRQMMHWAMAEARQANCYKLVLSSNQKRDRAHAFYEALGFRQHGYSFYVDLEDGCSSSSQIS